MREVIGPVNSDLTFSRNSHLPAVPSYPVLDDSVSHNPPTLNVRSTTIARRPIGRPVCRFDTLIP